MKEMFHAPVEVPKAEQETLRHELKGKIEQGLKDVEAARAAWVDAIEELNAKIPHDDVLVEQKTHSFDVLRCTWLWRIDELGQLEEELRGLQKELN